MLAGAEAELARATKDVAKLAHEMNLLSSVPVAEVAKDLAAQVLMIQATSAAGQESIMDNLFQRLVSQTIPKFREEVRRELAGRGGAA